MMMTMRRPEGKHEAREGEGIFKQEEAWMTIEQEDTLVHPFILRPFLHNSASRRIIQDGRSKKCHFGALCHLDFWEQFVEAADYTREKDPAARPTLIILVFFWLTSRPTRLSPVMHLFTLLRTDSGESPIVASTKYQTFSLLYSIDDLIYCDCKQERADRVSLMDPCRRGHRMTGSND